MLLGCGGSETLPQPTKSVSTPQPFLVIAHRGASALRPEHTLAAYELAIEQNADFIELDLVPTRDGALIARHENALAVVALTDDQAILRESSGSPKILQATTDVAERPEFAARLTVKTIDGRRVGGWFSEDFSLAEIKTLWARERIPQLRPNNVDWNDQFRIPTLEEAIKLLQRPGNARTGLYLELKHPTYFASEGRRLDGQLIAQDTAQSMIDVLRRQGFTHSSRLYLQCFEVAPLVRLQNELLPAAGFDAPLVQLFGGMAADSGPYDALFNLERGADMKRIYGPLAAALSGRPSYAGLSQPANLATMRALYAEGIGPGKGDLKDLASGAIHAGLEIHPYTVRPEAFFLSRQRGGLAASAVGELRLLRDQGATGVFIDEPAIATALGW